MPGVLGVFAGADCRADGLKPIPHDPVPSTKFDMKLTAPDGGPASTVFIGPHELLAVERARHVGEAVAMVVAETQAQAWDAAEAVLVDYEALPFAIDVEAALAPGAPQLYDAAPGNLLVDTHFGDAAATDAAFAKAAHVFTEQVHVPRASPMPIELRSGLAEYDAKARSLHAAFHLGRAGRHPSAQAICGCARRPTREAAPRLQRCRRQFRRAQPALWRIWLAALGGEEARPAGQIHGDALGRDDHRL